MGICDNCFKPFHQEYIKLCIKYDVPPIPPDVFREKVDNALLAVESGSLKKHAVVLHEEIAIQVSITDKAETRLTIGTLG